MPDTTAILSRPPRRPRGAARALVLAALTLAACSGGDHATGPGEGGGHVPAALVGRWYMGDVSSLQFYNSGSGSWDNAYGDGTSLTFHADGRFESGHMNGTSAYGCTMQELQYQKGTVDVDESAATFTVHISSGTAEGSNSCSPGSDYRRPVPPSTFTDPYMITQAADGTPQLVMHFQDGSELVFKRWDG